MLLKVITDLIEGVARKAGEAKNLLQTGKFLVEKGGLG